MPLKLDNTLLDELGLTTLPEPEKQSLLRHIYETLEMRVGMRLADQMTNEQLDEFEQFVNANDDSGAFKWLESNFPNYKDVVNDEFEKLKAEVGQVAPQILSQSQQAVAQGGQPGQPIQPGQQAPAGQVQPGQPAGSAPDPFTPVPGQPPAPQQMPQQPPQPTGYPQPGQPVQPQAPPAYYQAPPVPAQRPYVDPNSNPAPAPTAYPAQPQPDYPQQQPPAGPGQQPPQYPPQPAV